MDMSTLPDADLLLVLDFLTASQLLQCREVCCRWRQMALHPSLWRSRNLSADPMLKEHDDKFNRSRTCLAAALRVAPCARSIEVTFDDPAADVWFLALASTRCASSRLVLNMSASDSLLAAQVLSRQATLGRLKDVDLSVHSVNEDNKRRASALLHQLIHIEGLEAIDFYCNHADDMLLAPARTVPVRASLRRLKTISDHLNPYLRLLMKWHSATLEDVSIKWMSTPVAPLLSSMPRLRRLECALLEDMPALLQCPSLKSLEVSDGDTSTRAQVLGLQKLLRGAAARLEDVFLELSLEDTAEVLLSLGVTEAAPATLLTLCVFEASPELLPILAATLVRLPRLTTLQVDCGPSDAFLQALDGRVVPKLVDLTFSPPGCPYELAHSDKVRQLMRRYPLLHVFVDLSGKCAGCKYCEQGACPRRGDYVWILLSSHGKGVPCDVTHERSYYEVSLI